MPTKLVQNPEKNWAKMVGDTKQIKMVNGILSERLINATVPDDECHVKACIIQGLYDGNAPAEARVFAADYLHNQFSPDPTEKVNLVAWLEVLCACEDAIGVQYSQGRAIDVRATTDYENRELRRIVDAHLEDTEVRRGNFYSRYGSGYLK